MAYNTLTGTTPAQTHSQLLHIGEVMPGDLLEGARVRLGDGSSTPIYISNSAIAIDGSLLVSVDLVVKGNITAGGVPVTKRLTADVTAATNTQVALTQLDFIPETGAVYRVELSLIATSAATTTGVQIVNTSGAGSLIMAEPNGALSIAALGGTYAATSAPVAAAPFGILLLGVFSATSTAPLRFEVKSEVVASTVVLKAGSVIKVTRIS